MRDYFDMLGVSRGAPAVEIRRAVRRHASRMHPDFRNGGDAKPLTAGRAAPRDVAIDFVDMSAIVDRMQAAFLGTD